MQFNWHCLDSTLWIFAPLPEYWLVMRDTDAKALSRKASLVRPYSFKGRGFASKQEIVLPLINTGL